MLKRKAGGFLLAVLVLMTAGCATTNTGRSTQTDMDALNARLSALEGQLAAKDQEISSLQGQMAGERTAREAAEAERQRLAGQLDAARASKAKAPVSDLK